MCGRNGSVSPSSGICLSSGVLSKWFGESQFWYLVSVCRLVCCRNGSVNPSSGICLSSGVLSKWFRESQFWYLFVVWCAVEMVP